MVLDTIDIGVKIIVGTIHELSLQEFGGYAHLITANSQLDLISFKTYAKHHETRVIHELPLPKNQVFDYFVRKS